MKVAELLERRRLHWVELERLCAIAEKQSRRKLGPERSSRLAALYRAACGDLALADAYQLPPNTVQYLHRLVGRAHNQLYRSRSFDVRGWVELLLFHVPRRVFQDRCVQLTFCLFWAAFILSAYLAYSRQHWPDYAEQLLTKAQLDGMEESFREPLGGRDPRINLQMAAFYIRHNTGIGLKCFATGLLVVPGISTLLFNALHLGASFGYMARPDVEAGKNFFEFVTAHGPFELTAIVLSAGAGIRLGISWIKTDGLTRRDSLRRTAIEAAPLMGSAVVLFFGAALIEGFVSPTAAPYWLKATLAIVCSTLLMFYFVILGMPRGARATG